MEKIIKLSIKPVSGFLTELHSDTIFGHLCWRMRDYSGVDALVSFLKYFKEGNPIFSVSNAFLEKGNIQYFPFPNEEPPFTISKKKKIDAIKNFLKLKARKKIKYISLEKLNNFLKDCEQPANFLEADLSASPKIFAEIRTGVQISRESLKAEDEKLFRQAPKYLEDKDSNFFILVKVLNEELYKEYKIESLLKEVFTTGFGKKKTSGFGEFEILSYSEFNSIKETNNPVGFISLSNYLPSKNDGLSKNESKYDYFVKYGMLGEELASTKNPFKKPIIFMKPGSCFRTSNKKPVYGRITKESEISESVPYALQNGFAFTLNYGKE